MKSQKEKLAGKKYADTFDLYKRRSRDYEKLNLEFLRILHYYSENWDQGTLAKAALEAFDKIINDPPEYEKKYKAKYFIDINAK